MLSLKKKEFKKWESPSLLSQKMVKKLEIPIFIPETINVLRICMSVFFTLAIIKKKKKIFTLGIKNKMGIPNEIFRDFHVFFFFFFFRRYASTL